MNELSSAKRTATGSETGSSETGSSHLGPDEATVHDLRTRVLIVVLFVIASVSTVGFAWKWQEAEHSKGAYQELSARLAASVNDARAQGANVPDPKQTEAQVLQGATGPPGPAPTDEQVRAAVTAYLTANPPAAGRAPTDAEIATAVTNYCAANNCTGTNGTNGGTGPGPSDQQVAAAVASYCASHGDCIGSTGPQGPPGPPGPAPTGPFSCTGTLDHKTDIFAAICVTQ